jgi:hypothetical protein
MSTPAEQTKIAKNTRFATLGRAAADAHNAGQDTSLLLNELATLRQAEHQVSDRQIAFAGLARQLGDAHAAGKDTAPLLERAAQLRSQELGPASIS